MQNAKNSVHLLNIFQFNPTAATNNTDLFNGPGKSVAF